MNKRIKELAEQADIGFDEKYHWYVSNATLEKFAELIVNECLFIIADEHKWSAMVNRNDLWHQIDEYFGDEE